MKLNELKEKVALRITQQYKSNVGRTSIPKDYLGMLGFILFNATSLYYMNEWSAWLANSPWLKIIMVGATFGMTIASILVSIVLISRLPVILCFKKYSKKYFDALFNSLKNGSYNEIQNPNLDFIKQKLNEEQISKILELTLEEKKDLASIALNSEQKAALVEFVKLNKNLDINVFGRLESFSSEHLLKIKTKEQEIENLKEKNIESNAEFFEWAKIPVESTTSSKQSLKYLL